MSYYLQFYKNVHSQNGEDGIIHRLFHDMNIVNGECCEFGASDGVENSNTLELVKIGWKSLMIEHNAANFESPIDLEKRFNNLTVFYDMVEVDGEKTIDRWLAKVDFKRDFELLSIDVDGYDNLIWESMTNYDPKIVVIETNSAYKGRLAVWQKKNSEIIGTSAYSLVMFVLERGYYPVANTGNLILVKQEFISALSMPESEKRDWSFVL